MSGIPVRNGFTILEVLVVLVVVSILSAASFRPGKAFLQNLERKRTTDAIKNMLYTARGRAQSDPSTNVGVHVKAAKDSAAVFMFLDISMPMNYSYDPFGDKLYKTIFKVPKGYTLSIATGYPVDIVFRGDGSGQFSAKWIITGPRGIDTIDVLASTGRVRVLR